MKPFERLAVFGVGLIGASLGLAARKAGLAREIVGVGRREESLRRALDRGAVDRYCTSPEEGFAGADLVVLCAPVGAVLALFERGLPGLGGDALLTDACSTKRAVVEAAGRCLPRPGRFVGAHPIAGSEQSGPGAARADLFEGRSAILTPVANTDEQALETVSLFWSGIGSRVCRMTPEDHDRVLALTSHLPHLLAAAASQLVARERDELVLACLGTGFRDFSRVAAGDAALWREIMETNCDNLERLVASFSELLSCWREKLRSTDGPGLESFLAEGAGFQRLMRATQSQGKEEKGGRQKDDA